MLNAANEVAVESFLHGRIGFLDIARVVEQSLADTPQADDLDLEAILAADKSARVAAQQAIGTL